MEDLTLPSVGASFKKWGCCTPILPKTLAHYPNFQNSKKIQKKGTKPDEPSVDGLAGHVYMG
jgi:hypothetical protein